MRSENLHAHIGRTCAWQWQYPSEVLVSLRQEHIAVYSLATAKRVHTSGGKL